MNFKQNFQHFLFNIQWIKNQLKNNGQLPFPIMNNLVNKIKIILKNEPNVIDLSSPLYIFGDIHGQYYDLLNLLQKYNDFQKYKYLFLGDYVDRGNFNIQVLTILLCLKLNFPKQIYLLRGNHQCRVLTTSYNFRNQCLQKYTQDLYNKITDLFDCLPICAIVNNKYFVVHGGISPDLKVISQLFEYDRFREVPKSGLICDLLWSDPIDQFTGSFKKNVTRNCSYYYGFDQAKSFLTKNNFKMIIRGHQVHQNGFKYQKYQTTPLTITIFSAPNYAGIYNNKGAIARIINSNIDIIPFCATPEPQLNIPLNGFVFSYPILKDCLQKLCKYMNEVNLIESILKQKNTKFNQFLNQIVNQIDSTNIIQQQLRKYTNKIKNKPQIIQFQSIKQLDQFQKMPQYTYVIGPKIKQYDFIIKQLPFFQVDQVIQEQ